MRSQIYLSVSAAPGNIGDIFIRRNALRCLVRDDQSDLHVFVGEMPADYVASVGIPDGAAVYRKSVRFVVSMLLALVLRGSCCLVVAPGPAFLGRSLRSRLKHLSLCVFSLAVRLRGWSVLVLGRSAIGGKGFDIFVERLLCRISSIYVTRDIRTLNVVGSNARFYPDLAFLSLRDQFPQRDRGDLVVSVRGDRVLPEQFSASVESLAESFGLSVKVVTQVRDDNVRNELLASKLGADHLAWPSEVSAGEQERRLLDAYSNASLCISDRLHVVALCVVNGAYPVVYTSDHDTKLVDALSSLFPFMLLDSAADLVGSAIDDVDRENFRESYGRVSECSLSLESEVAGILSRRGGG